MSPICLECDEPYRSEGDCSGVCASCRDEREEQARIDDMDEATYVRWKAQQANRPFHIINRLKVA